MDAPANFLRLEGVGADECKRLTELAISVRVWAADIPAQTYAFQHLLARDVFAAATELGLALNAIDKLTAFAVQIRTPAPAAAPSAKVVAMIHPAPTDYEKPTLTILEPADA
ncbi:MAG TPA: hypothetical protein VG735_07865 [Caulobacterales bacterium]|nr:hypothetical protein [Caulobacterales bacterium]